MSDTAQADSCVTLAHQLADAASKITLAYFRTILKIEDKPDESPVTRADRETEATLRRMINATFPTHGIIGEEYGTENEDAEFVWALDPIDGTVSFINGVPLFTTIVGLLKEGVPWFGLVDQPVLKDRWAGGAGSPTTLNGEPARVRECGNLNQASVYITTPDMFSSDELARVDRLGEAVKLRRFGGTDCYHYGMVASGWTDMVCEKLSVYEYGAMVPIITNAGGVMTDWQGAALTGTKGRQVLASGDRRVHDAAIAVLTKESS
jgi:inositol-phosphate phosphatase / L-galactose 1-phosphate phosphatase / histidinol-phosphatase